jgi:hypothetical protein
MSLLRLSAATALFALTLTACGGDGAEPTTPDGTTGQTPDQGSSEASTTSVAETGGTAGSGEGGGGGGGGDDSLEYTISGGYEASGVAPMVPTMSFFSDGVWSVTFGDESGTILLLFLDPSTPSVNFTDGTSVVAGDGSDCEFDITSQDANGASGSFDCSNVAATISGVLGEVSEFSGTFDFQA